MNRKSGSGKEQLLTHVLLFVACVAFPACLTAIAPVSWAGVREKMDIDSSDRNREVTTESEGSLVLHGVGEEKVVVQVSPSSLEGISRDARDFLAEKERPEFHFFAPASWKVSVIVGGAVCLLTLLYLVVVVSGLIYRVRTAGGSK